MDYPVKITGINNVTVAFGDLKTERPLVPSSEIDPGGDAENSGPQIRWLEGPSKPRQASDQERA
jgi:hypothetical protein